MQKFLTDVHNHSTFSHDGVSKLSDMLQTAQEKGVCFYGVSEHFDFDMLFAHGRANGGTDAEEYFHSARHLQEDYAGVMNVLIGVELGFSPDERVLARNREIVEKYRPDFVVNSIHTVYAQDYYKQKPFRTTTCEGVEILRPKKEVYEEYLRFIRRSLEVDYEYDIVGHLGYPARYAPYADKVMPYAEFSKDYDDILTAIIEKNKILEVNASNGGASVFTTVASQDVLQRYYELGGRQVSYASDAHSTQSILRNREKVVEMLKTIGFTYVTVPCRGEYIKVEI